MPDRNIGHDQNIRTSPSYTMWIARGPALVPCDPITTAITAETIAPKITDLIMPIAFPVNRAPVWRR